MLFKIHPENMGEPVYINPDEIASIFRYYPDQPHYIQLKSSSKDKNFGYSVSNEELARMKSHPEMKKYFVD